MHNFIRYFLFTAYYDLVNVYALRKGRGKRLSPCEQFQTENTVKVKGENCFLAILLKKHGLIALVVNLFRNLEINEMLSVLSIMSNGEETFSCTLNRASSFTLLCLFSQFFYSFSAFTAITTRSYEGSSFHGSPSLKHSLKVSRISVKKNKLNAES